MNLEICAGLARTATCFARLIASMVLLWLETHGIGRRLYYLPFPRDRREVENNPELLMTWVRRSGLIPDSACNLNLEFVAPSQQRIADVGKVQRVFLVTVSWTEASVQKSITMCVKTGRFRGPYIIQLFLAAIGFQSREQAFYTHIAPVLKKQGVYIPACHASGISPLLTHTFFLLEAPPNVVVFNEGAEQDTALRHAALAVFLREEARVHAAFWKKGADDSRLRELGGSILLGVIETSAALRDHKNLLTAALKFATRCCPQSLVHGDARLGNALLHMAGNRCTLVDWEVAAPGTPIFDILYCIWLCQDGDAVNSCMNVTGGSSLLSQSDWELVQVWKEEVERQLLRRHGEGSNPGSTMTTMWNDFAPLSEEIAVVSLLLAAYVWAIGAAGFGEVWKGGNNQEDLEAWARRVKRRVASFAKNTASHKVIARCLVRASHDLDVDGGSTDIFSFAQRLAQVQKFLASACSAQLWTEGRKDSEKSQMHTHKSRRTRTRSKQRIRTPLAASHAKRCTATKTAPIQIIVVVATVAATIAAIVEKYRLACYAFFLTDVHVAARPTLAVLLATLTAAWLWPRRKLLLPSSNVVRAPAHSNLTRSQLKRRRRKVRSMAVKVSTQAQPVRVGSLVYYTPSIVGKPGRRAWHADNPCSAETIKVLHRASRIIVIDKPAPLATMKSEQYRNTNLRSRLKCQLGISGRLSTLHRLDICTTGVLLCTSDKTAARHFLANIRNRKVKKIYVAKVIGKFPSRLQIHGERLLECCEPVDGKPARTIFKLVETSTSSSGATRSVVLAMPFTGRKHQIRIHLAAMGHPIENDPVYNSDVATHQQFVEKWKSGELLGCPCTGSPYQDDSEKTLERMFRDAVKRSEKSALLPGEPKDAVDATLLRRHILAFQPSSSADEIPPWYAQKVCTSPISLHAWVYCGEGGCFSDDDVKAWLFKAPLPFWARGSKTNRDWFTLLANTVGRQFLENVKIYNHWVASSENESDSESENASVHLTNQMIANM